MSDDACTHKVSGELTFQTVPALLQRSEGWFAGSGDLVLDLAQVERTDSAGLALLIEWLRRARSMQRQLRFSHIPEQVLTLIRINGLQDALLNHKS